MNISKGMRAGLALALLVSLTGCKPKSDVIIDSVMGPDHTAGIIDGSVRKHAWVVAGVDNQSVTFNISVRNSQHKTHVPLNPDSVLLQGTGQYFQIPPYSDSQLSDYQTSSLTLDLSSIALPELNASTGTRTIPYTVKATYGSADVVSAPGYVEVLRPYCQVNATPHSTLGMTFETPRGAAPAGGWPTLLFVHGGGLVGRNHVDMEAYAKNMLAQGYAVANMDYRMFRLEGKPAPYSQAQSWEDPVSDVKCAIRYLKVNARRLRLDAGKIGLVGHSSGANIALEAATTVGSAMPEYAEQGTPVRSGSIHGRVDTSVAAIFTMDAIVNYVVFWHYFDQSTALLEKNSLFVARPYIQKAVNRFKAQEGMVSGVDFSQPGWETQPSVVAQNVANFVDATMNLPIYMENSTVNPARKSIVQLPSVAYNAWKSSCTFYNAVEASGNAVQLGNTFIKENANTDHYDFIQTETTVTSVSSDMGEFFNYYLKNQGSKPATGFDIGRCASL